MNYKISLRTFSVIFVIIGAMFFMYGPGVLSYFGVKEIPGVWDLNGGVADFWKMIAFERLFGAAVLMFGVLIGFLAYIEGAKNKRYVSFGSALGLFVLIAIMLSQQIAILETVAGWILLVVFLLIFIGFVILAYKKETVQ